MWKTVVAGAAALAIAGSSLVYAQQRDRNADQGQHWQHHGDHHGARGAGAALTPEDRAAFTDARIAAMKAGLRLTPDQEKNWPAFETAVRDIAKARAEAYGAHRAMARGGTDESAAEDPVVRMRHHAEMLTTAGANLKRLADAQEPLYASLDDSQKRRFNLLAKVLTAPNRHFAQAREHRRHEMRGGMRGHEMRGDNSRGPRARGMDDRHGDNNNTGSAMGERL